MAHSHQILNELLTLSELVAKLPAESPYRAPAGYFENLGGDLMNRITSLEQESPLPSGEKCSTPFTVPAGYFNELSDTILNRIKLQDGSSAIDTPEHLSPLLLKLKEAESFTIPEGYFDTLSGNILDRISILENTSETEELELLSPLLLKLRKAVTFQLPEGYFDELPETIIHHIQLEELPSQSGEPDILSPLLLQLKKEAPFTLPEKYFQDFPSDVMAGVNAVEYVNQELEAHTPILNDSRIKNAYEVPEGYFDTLGDTLLSNLKKRHKAPVISINFNKRLMRYGVAALLAGAMSIAAWMFFQNKPANTGGELSAIEKISNDEMQAYLENTPDTPDENGDNGTGAALYTMKDEDVQELLTDVPDEELRQYLDQHAEEKDLLIN